MSVTNLVYLDFFTFSLCIDTRYFSQALLQHKVVRRIIIGKKIMAMSTMKPRIILIKLSVTSECTT